MNRPGYKNAKTFFWGDDDPLGFAQGDCCWGGGRSSGGAKTKKGGRFASRCCLKVLFRIRFL